MPGRSAREGWGGFVALHHPAKSSRSPTRPTCTARCRDPIPGTWLLSASLFVLPGPAWVPRSGLSCSSAPLATGPGRGEQTPSHRHLGWGEGVMSGCRGHLGNLRPNPQVTQDIEGHGHWGGAEGGSTVSLPLLPAPPLGAWFSLLFLPSPPPCLPPLPSPPSPSQPFPPPLHLQRRISFLGLS